MEIVEGKKTGSKVYKIGSELYTIEKRHHKSDSILYVKCSKYKKTFVKLVPQLMLLHVKFSKSPETIHVDKTRNNQKSTESSFIC